MNKINDNLYTFEGQQDIVSPQLVYYPAIIRENIRKMIDIAGGAARLWPHIKTHKMAEVVQMQIEAGIDRFKCATIAEAEMAAKAGAKHLTLAYPLVGPNIKRFAALQAAFPEVEFFAIGDDTEQIRKLGQTCKANVLMDVDMGQHRTGVPLDKVEAMYREWNTLPGIVMRGMHCYDGHRHESSVQEREVATAPVDKQIEEIKARLKADGICCEILIMGGTPSFPVHAEMTGEFLSPGTCVIQDAGYRNAYPDLKFTPAAALLTRVVSRPQPRHLHTGSGLQGRGHRSPAGARGDRGHGVCPHRDPERGALGGACAGRAHCRHPAHRDRAVCHPDSRLPHQRPVPGGPGGGKRQGHRLVEGRCA